jgi:hypothetical protein
MKSSALAIICPSAELVRDATAPLLFSVWLDGDIIGAADRPLAAVISAVETLVEWERAGVTNGADPNALHWRSFSESDWWGFAGAECFENGDQPLIAEMEISGLPAVICHDRNGASIFVADESWSIPEEELLGLRTKMSRRQIAAIPGAEQVT